MAAEIGNVSCPDAVSNVLEDKERGRALDSAKMIALVGVAGNQIVM